MFSHKSVLVLGSVEAGDLISLVKSGGYQLSNCEYMFEQGYDGTGRVQTAVLGGVLYVTLCSTPPAEILEWMLNPRKYLDGAIVVLDNEMITDEKIFFERAICIHCDIDYTQTGENYATTNLVIQAQRLNFSNGVTFRNEWNED